MLITATTIKNFKRIEDIEIRPGADRTLVLIGGKNAQGKSSILDALTAAFGGKRAQPIDPVRHGAESAEITVELDGGEMQIKRVIQPDGDSVIEVRDRLGAMKSPQAILDKLIGARFLDPLQFLALQAKEQRVMLMRLIEGADRIAGLDQKRERAFSRRTEVGRELTKATGELGRLPEVKVEEPIDFAALGALARQLDATARGLDTARARHEQCERETDQAKANLASVNAQREKLEAEIERLKGQVVELGTKSAEWAEDIKKCEEVEAAAKANVDETIARVEKDQPQRDAIAADMERAQSHNRAVATAEAHMQRRAETAETVAALTKERGDLTKVIETIDARKAEILSAAKLPVDGLGLDDTGITLNGVPFVQASGAEKLRVALGLAIAASPGLGDVWIRDGALLDEESLAIVKEHAARSGNRVWLERVGVSDPGVIVIADGKVAS